MWKYIKNSRSFFSRIQLILVILFFFGLTLFFFRDIIFEPGIIVGQDWMLPVNVHQMEQYVDRPFYTWTYDMNLFGVKNPFSVQMPFVLLVKLFLFLGLSGEALSKTLILLIFTFSGTSMFLLLRFLGIKTASAVIGGFILITMPVFFNYTVMGWCFVLFSIGIMLPLTLIFFIKSVEENKILHAIIAGLLYSVAILQSQSLVWFPMVFFALGFYLIKNKRSFLAYLRTGLIVGGVALLLHSTWWPNLFINQDVGVMNSDLALDSVSQGMRSRLSFVNIQKAWGSLFNQPYEVSYPDELVLLSYLIPFLAFASLTLRTLGKKRDLRIPLSILLLYMFAFFSIEPSALAKIPFSNLIRDTARFTALSSFALTILASYFLDFLFERENKKRHFFYLLIPLVVLNSFLFFSGALTSPPVNVYDVRLRNYLFPVDYSHAEDYLYTIKADAKSYYPPSGTNIGIKNQPMFNGDFREIKDPFRGYSPLASTIYMYYSSMGKPTEASFLLDSLFEKRVTDVSLMVMGMMNIKDIIIRNDTIYPPIQSKSILDFMSRSGNDILNFGKVQVVENKYFLPHFYIPDTLVYSPNNVDILPDIITFNPYPHRTAVYLGQESVEINKVTGQVEGNNGFVDPEIPKIADQVFIEVDESNQKKHEMYVPRDGDYILYGNDNMIVKLDGEEKIAPSANNRSESPLGAFSEWGKVNLNKGWHNLEISYKESTNISMPEAWAPKIVLRNILPTTLISSKYNTSSSDSKIPKITFTKINPTKYKIKVEGAVSPYTLVFSESFHDGWSVYLDQDGRSMKNNFRNVLLHTIGRVGSSVVGIFVKDGGFGEDTVSYFDDYIKEGVHRSTFLEPATFETWGKDPIAEKNHSLVNGYANSWYITPQDVGGKEDYDLVVEFVPQRFFYAGFFVLVTTLIGCLAYLVYNLWKRIVSQKSTPKT